MEASAVPESAAALLRIEVRRFATECGTRRAALPTLAHVGTPAGLRTTLPTETSYDAGLRADLLTRALDGFDDPAPLVAWLTRGGFLTACDDDLAWLSAADAAFARHGVAARFFAVTRHGWLEVRTGETRSWRRVRPLREGAPAGSSPRNGPARWRA